MDQFTFAERATDWRGNNNIAESIFEQMAQERHPVPTWIVVGAGTGGTQRDPRPLRALPAATAPGVAVADPENSAFFPAGRTGDGTSRPASAPGSRASAARASSRRSSAAVIDRMVQVPDAASLAAMRFCSKLLGRAVGGSTGTDLWGALRLVAAMRAAGEQGSVVTLLCDGGERYLQTYYDDDWVAAQGLDLAPYTAVLERFTETGEWPHPGSGRCRRAAGGADGPSTSRPTPPARCRRRFSRAPRSPGKGSASSPSPSTATKPTPSTSSAYRAAV